MQIHVPHIILKTYFMKNTRVIYIVTFFTKKGSFYLPNLLSIAVLPHVYVTLLNSLIRIIQNHIIRYSIMIIMVTKNVKLQRWYHFYVVFLIAFMFSPSLHCWLSCQHHISDRDSMASTGSCNSCGWHPLSIRLNPMCLFTLKDVARVETRAINKRHHNKPDNLMTCHYV